MVKAVVHCKKDKFDVYIGRPSKWGNPYNVKEYGRDFALLYYRVHIMTNKELWDALDELEGKVLGCWCKPKNCHGDILKELYDAKQREKQLFD